MCGRLNVHADPLARVFVLLTGAGFPGETQNNIAPTESLWVVVNASSQEAGAPKFAAKYLRWWLTPYWSSDPKPKYAMFNARAEGLEDSRAFRGAFERRRCVVPVSGFYEWIKEGKTKHAQHVAAASSDCLLLAGLWDRWRHDNEVVESFAIVTTQANPALAFLHDRQPLMLNEDQAAIWMDADRDLDEVRALLTSELPMDLNVVPVSEYVNNVRNKGNECLTPLGNPRFVAATRAS